MKRIKILFTLSVAILSLISVNSNAQGFYIEAGSGYGWKAASQSIGDNYSFTNSGSTFSSSDQNVKGSFGAGWNFGGAFGYMFSEHIGAELGISYLSGSNIQLTNNTNDVGNYSTSRTITISGSMLRLNPTIKIGGEPGRITPYIKVGLVIGISPSITITNDSTYSYSTFYPTVTTIDTVVAQTNKLSGGTSFGFSVALGADVRLNNLISLYGEIGMIGQTYAPTSGTLTSYTKDGADQLSTMTTSQKQITYVDSYTTSSSAPTNAALPSQQLKVYEPFSSWGINIGVHLTFGGNK